MFGCVHVCVCVCVHLSFLLKTVLVLRISKVQNFVFLYPTLEGRKEKGRRERHRCLWNPRHVPGTFPVHLILPITLRQRCYHLCFTSKTLRCGKGCSPSLAQLTADSTDLGTQIFSTPRTWHVKDTLSL